MNHQAQVRWDWTAEDWSWIPLERWSPRHGLPDTPGYAEVSTTGLDARRAYEFWRETALCHFEADLPFADGRTGFNAETRALLCSAGDFCYVASDGVSGRRTRARQRIDDGEDIDIGLVLSGRWYQQQAGDRATVTGPGEFFCFDATRPSRITWNRHRGLYLTLRRPAIEATLGRSVPTSSTVIGALAASPVTPLLKDQLLTLSKRMRNLSAGRRTMLLDQTIELALFALRESLDDPHRKSEGESERSGLLVAALRYIERHLGDPSLDVAMIAHALNRSRATLYRAFESCGLTVAGAIRERRLLHARQLLEWPRPYRSVGDVAAVCGFIERRSFNRLFRDRFSLQPREVIASRKSSANL